MQRKTLSALVGALALAFTTIACAETDPGITTAVKGKLAADDTVKAYRIDVDTKDHVVTLSGAVDTAAAKARAVELARATDGVQSVVDQLTVTPGATPTTGTDDELQREGREAARDADAKTDEAQRKAGETADDAGNAAANATLTTKVKTKVLADERVSGLKIDVDSNNGIVTLTGTVATAAEKNAAIALAKNTDGVKSVVDRLKVSR